MQYTCRLAVLYYPRWMSVELVLCKLSYVTLQKRRRADDESNNRLVSGLNLLKSRNVKKHCVCWIHMYVGPCCRFDL